MGYHAVTDPLVRFSMEHEQALAALDRLERAASRARGIGLDVGVVSAAEARRLIDAAHAQTEADRTQAFQALKSEVGTLAVDLASRVVGESLADEARQRRTVERFLAELETQPESASR